MRLLLNSAMHHCQWHVASLDLMLTQALTGHNMRSTSFHFIRHSLEGEMMPYSSRFVPFFHPSFFLSILLVPCFPLLPVFSLVLISTPFCPYFHIILSHISFFFFTLFNFLFSSSILYFILFFFDSLSLLSLLYHTLFSFYSTTITCLLLSFALFSPIFILAFFDFSFSLPLYIYPNTNFFALFTFYYLLFIIVF